MVTLQSVKGRTWQKQVCQSVQRIYSTHHFNCWGILAPLRSGLSARVPECQKNKMKKGGLDHGS